MRFTASTSALITFLLTLSTALYIPPTVIHGQSVRRSLSPRAPPPITPFLDSAGNVVTNPDEPIVGFPGDIPLPPSEAPAVPEYVAPPVKEAPVPAPEAPAPAPVEPAPKPVVTAAPAPPPQQEGGGDPNVVVEYAYSTRFRTEIVYVTAA